MSTFYQFLGSGLDYQTLKILHIFGVVLFLGNIIITGWWKVMADKTGDYRIIAFAQRQVTLTDWIFTFGGVLIILIAGFGMTGHMGEDAFQQRWLRWGYGLFVLSGVIWVFVLLPVQILQARMAKRFAESGDIPDRYWKYGKIWLWFGITATVIPLANLYWMVVKS